MHNPIKLAWIGDLEPPQKYERVNWDSPSQKVLI